MEIADQREVETQCRFQVEITQKFRLSRLPQLFKEESIKTTLIVDCQTDQPEVARYVIASCYKIKYRTTTRWSV